MTTYECDDCEWRGTPDEMEWIRNIDERVLMGELMPAGECPECGSLCSVQNIDVPEYSFNHFAELMVQRGWKLVDPAGDIWAPPGMVVP